MGIFQHDVGVKRMGTTTKKPRTGGTKPATKGVFKCKYTDKCVLLSDCHMQ